MAVDTIDYTSLIPQTISQKSIKTPEKKHSCSHDKVNLKVNMMKTFKAVMLMNEGYVNKITPYSFQMLMQDEKVINELAILVALY
jgi:hypothetical protein